MGDDVELGQRLERAGFRLHYLASAVARFDRSVRLAELADRQRRKGWSGPEIDGGGWSENTREALGLYSRRAFAEVVTALERALEEHRVEDRELLWGLLDEGLHYAMLVGRAEREGELEEGVDAVVALLARASLVDRDVRRQWRSKDRQLAELAQALGEREQTLAELERQWQSKDDALAEADRQWRSKDRQLAELGARVEELEARLAAAQRAAAAAGDAQWRPWHEDLRRLVARALRAARRRLGLAADGGQDGS
jgi:DNA repair exonuclease SbcCD ATPase subunit